MQQRRRARCRRPSGRARSRAPLGPELKLSCAMPPLLLLRSSLGMCERNGSSADAKGLQPVIQRKMNRTSPELSSALAVDARLTEIERELNLLPNFTPTNGAEAWAISNARGSSRSLPCSRGRSTSIRTWSSTATRNP